MSEPTFLAIIPARGGSKRLPGKNVKELNGKPLIAWTIEAALLSSFVDTVIVSTDDIEIAEVSVAAGAEVPFIRPKSLSSDISSTVDVIRHAVEFYERREKNFDYIVLLQPTSPLRTATHVTKAIELLKVKGADAVVSVCEVEHSPLWSNTLPASGSLKLFIKDEVKNKRSQDLEPYYRLNGAIYLIKTSSFIEHNTLFLKENAFAYIMEPSESVDIDNQIDFSFAEFMMQEVDALD